MQESDLVFQPDLKETLKVVEYKFACFFFICGNRYPGWLKLTWSRPLSLRSREPDLWIPGPGFFMFHITS